MSIMCVRWILFSDLTYVIRWCWLGPELFALGSSSECYFQRLDDNDRMFEINITAYTKDTGHDIWSLDTDAAE